MCRHKNKIGVAIEDEFEKLKDKFTCAKRGYKAGRDDQRKIICDRLRAIIETDDYANFAVQSINCDTFRGPNRQKGSEGKTKFKARNNESKFIQGLNDARGGLPPHDLSNWQWISIVYWKDIEETPKSQRISVMDICLQTPNFDEGTRNHHVVFDRVCLIDGGDGNDGFNGCGSYEDTGLELPFDEDKMGKLEQYVCERLERWCQVNGIDPKTGRHLPAED